MSAPQWRLVERVPGVWSEIIGPDGEDVLGEWIKADAAAIIIRAVNAHDALVAALRHTLDRATGLDPFTEAEARAVLACVDDQR